MQPERDKIFKWKGFALLVDTAVLPTIRCKPVTSGGNWTEGHGLSYLAFKFNLKPDLDLLADLSAEWTKFTTKYTA